MQIRSLGQKDPFEEEMETHFSILVCNIPWTGEPGGLQSMQSQIQTALNNLACTSLGIAFPSIFNK